MRAFLSIFLNLSFMLIAGSGRAAPPDYPIVQPGLVLSFPTDHGAHPNFRTEWWYLTGWLETGDGKKLGFQITFFRSRPPIDQDNPSAFAPTQILFAHAALSDPAIGQLQHAQRIARTGFGIAEAAVGDTSIVLDDWTLRRRDDGHFVAEINGDNFSFDLDFAPTQPVLIEGDGGYSRKGPSSADASYYFSLPHLRVTGDIRHAGKQSTVHGEAWLDREWSSTLLDPLAVGWDWVGLNLDDGGAVMAFQMRDRDGKSLWAGGTIRRNDGTSTVLGREAIAFNTLRTWHSARTGADYPIERALTVGLPGDERHYIIKPLFDDQELDSRTGGGPVYWEGAVETTGGRGYLELTGYVDPLKF